MRTWIAIVATAVATGLSVHLAEVRAAETVVTATRFQLVDQAGNPRGYFGFAGADSQPQLVLVDAAGVSRWSSGLASNDGSPAIRFFDANNVLRAELLDTAVVFGEDLGAQEQGAYTVVAAGAVFVEGGLSIHKPATLLFPGMIKLLDGDLKTRLVLNAVPIDFRVNSKIINVLDRDGRFRFRR